MYNIVRFRKIKEDIEIKKMEEHNFRKTKVINADKNKESLNKKYIKYDNHNKAFNELKEKYKFKTREKGKNKSVKYVEFIISASSDFFKDKSIKEIEQYFIDNIKILKERFFQVDGSLVSVSFHYDETTPHAHLIFVPILKNKDDKTYCLSCKKLFGDKNKCIELQSIVNEELNQLGWNLERGNRVKKANHQTLKDFYQEINERKEEYERVVNENEVLINYLRENNLQNDLKNWLGAKRNGYKIH